jgi:S-disulfanyl-L-cysteine oxidoreductase SoxD
MSMRDGLAVVLALVLNASAMAGDTPMLGKPATMSDLAPWDISVMPDGRGLPSGSGTAAEGAGIFIAKCMSCHGEKGAGGPLGPALSSIGHQKQFKLIGNYWPYATTIFDYTRRAMPWRVPKMLYDDEIYALTAYILASNEIIGENDEMNAQTLPEVKMPNRDGVIGLQRENR